MDKPLVVKDVVSMNCCVMLTGAVVVESSVVPKDNSVESILSVVSMFAVVGTSSKVIVDSNGFKVVVDDMFSVVLFTSVVATTFVVLW